VGQETEGLYEAEHKTSDSQELVSVASKQGIGHFTCDMLREKVRELCTVVNNSH